MEKIISKQSLLTLLCIIAISPLYSMEQIAPQSIPMCAPIQTLAHSQLDKRTIEKAFEDMFEQLCVVITQQNNPARSIEWLHTDGASLINQNIKQLQESIKKRYFCTVQQIYREASQATRMDHIRELNNYCDHIATVIHQSTKKIERNIKALIQLINSTKTPDGKLIDHLQKPQQLKKTIEKKVIYNTMKKCGRATICAAKGASLFMIFHALLSKIM